ncbi:hypothetical protein FA10DRAFT_267438 [Acaromyces ingoldii]|uniref:Maintenance of telomere capping protein 1 n=1 Tax=Acaromyces ingoldii TaxID=215250 RepID=A0A316YQS4_9BASI|nr:hypothetical protein FA10DRAFT_267438 [Acaromyces ingoldii]PWN91018.1 hypothetical protein FA10DRAFT_267438 [Acaromyces ingoldii]
MAPPKKPSKKDDVEALLSDLDSLGTGSGSKEAKKAAATEGAGAGAGAKAKDDAQSLLDDLDELVKRRAATPKRTPSAAATPAAEVTPSATPSGTLSRSAAAMAASADGSKEQATAPSERDVAASPSEVPVTDPSTTTAAATSVAGAGAGTAAGPGAGAAAGGWGNWWSSAQKLADQARAELEKRAAQAAQAGKDLASEVRQSEEEARRQGIPSLTSVAENASQAVSRTAKGDPWSLARSMLGSGSGDGGSGGGGIRNFNLQELSQMGKRGWMDIVNAVAPPIARHEVLQVSLSHDMVGYEGIDDLVFRVLGRVVETHAAQDHAQEGNEGPGQQQIIVNKSRTQQSMEDERTDAGTHARSMNALDSGGFEHAWKTAETKLDALIQATYTPAPAQDTAAKDGDSSSSSSSDTSAKLPITTCPLYIRIQPLLASLPGLESSTDTPRHLYFAVVLNDPSNGLVHRTISSPVPADWFDEAGSGSHSDRPGPGPGPGPEPWAEEFLVEILEACLGAIGLDYVRQRQTSRTRVAQEIKKRVASE